MNLNFVTSMAIFDDREQIKHFNEPALFVLDGTEEQVLWKLKRNALAIIAKHHSAKNNTELTDELDKLVTKHNLGEFPK